MVKANKTNSNAGPLFNYQKHEKRIAVVLLWWIKTNLYYCVIVLWIELITAIRRNIVFSLFVETCKPLTINYYVAAVEGVWLGLVGTTFFHCTHLVSYSSILAPLSLFYYTLLLTLFLVLAKEKQKRTFSITQLATLCVWVQGVINLSRVITVVIISVLSHGAWRDSQNLIAHLLIHHFIQFKV